MDIKFVDIVRQYNHYQSEIMNAIELVLNKGNFILGEEVEQFEDSFKDFIGCKYAVGVDSGTSALLLSISALNLKNGDEVITVPNTFISTAYSISECGASVKFVDVDEATQLMDVEQLEKSITSNTKALIPVHLFGQMVNMENILRIAKKYNLYIIEDVCQSHGAEQNGIKAGSIGDLGCFSFYPGKNLGAFGDAGMITTNNKELYEKLLLLRNYGSIQKYFHEIKGKNARLDTIQAAVLSVKLKYLNECNLIRNKIAAKYSQELQNVGDIILPVILENNFSVFHIYCIRTKKRDELKEFLLKYNIPSIIHYPVPIHLQKAYSELNHKKNDFPVSEKLADEIISLPIHPEMYDDEIYYIIQTIKKFFTNKINLPL
ncbi:MAG: DegT/DnrJ/EryC1/StrS family aminotransferase [Bacteroidota bacterium]